MRLKRAILRLLIRRHKILSVPKELEEKLPRIRNLRRTIDSFSDEEIPVYFRFRSKEQLHRLMRGFQIPMQVKLPKTGNVFEGKNCFLSDCTDSTDQRHYLKAVSSSSLEWDLQQCQWPSMLSLIS